MIVAKSVYDISSIEKGPLDSRFEEQDSRDVTYSFLRIQNRKRISTNTLKVAINCGYVIVRNWNGEIGGEDFLKKKKLYRERKEGRKDLVLCRTAEIQS